MTDHAELLRRWQRMYNAMDSKHEDKWPKDDDFQKLRQDTHAALAARPVTPAPINIGFGNEGGRSSTATAARLSLPASAPKFPTMLRKMWSGGEVQAWINEHWPTTPASAPEALSEPTKPWAQKTALGKAPSLIIELETAAERFTRYSNDSIDGLLQEAADVIRALAAPSTPAAPSEAQERAAAWLVGEASDPELDLAATQAQASAPEALSERKGILVEALAAGCPHPGTIQGQTDKDWSAWAKELCAEARAALAAPSTPASGKASEPFLYAIMGPDGAAHLDEQCVSSVRGDLDDTVFCLNDEHVSGPYRVVELFRPVADAATRPVQPAAAGAPDHIADASKMVAADLSDAEIEALFLQFAEANERGAMWIRTYVEGFRHLARAILAANKGAGMNADGWIACADRLPDLDVPVFGTAGMGISVYMRDHGCYEGWLWARQTWVHDLASLQGFECDDDYEVTHWRPLFALPGGAP